MNQQWVEMVVEGLWMAWLLLWLLMAFNNKRSVYRQPPRERLAYVLLTVGAFMLFHRIPGAHTRFLPGGAWTEIPGVGMVVAGMAFAVWARVTLGRNWSGIVTVKENHELVQTGPYALVRHPIYTGILFAMAGTVLAMVPSPLGLAMLGLLTVAFWFKWRKEERMMTGEFPEAYPAYRRRVRAAVVPWLL